MERDAKDRTTSGIDPGFGGWWTEAKLGILGKYLSAFTVASQRADATVYLDLFAGRLWNQRPDTRANYVGSSGVAMQTRPEFTRLVFWELSARAENLRRDLGVRYPRDERAHVVTGDCNETLDEGLQHIADLRWAPTFAFIDPKGLDVSWTTLEQLSRWRRERKGRKTELWMLLPEPALSRVLGLQGVRGQSSADLLSNLYGSDDWIAIHQVRIPQGEQALEASGQFRVPLFTFGCSLHADARAGRVEARSCLPLAMSAALCWRPAPGSRPSRRSSCGAGALIVCLGVVSLPSGGTVMLAHASWPAWSSLRESPRLRRGRHTRAHAHSSGVSGRAF